MSQVLGLIGILDLIYVSARMGCLLYQWGILADLEMGQGTCIFHLQPF